MVKNLPANAGDVRDVDLIPELGILPGRGNDTCTPVFLLGQCHGQKNLESYSPWGCEESDMSKHTHTDRHTHTDSHTHLPAHLSIILTQLFSYLFLFVCFFFVCFS